jgi:hypothetical protein
MERGAKEGLSHEVRAMVTWGHGLREAPLQNSIMYQLKGGGG